MRRSTRSRLSIGFVMGALLAGLIATPTQAKVHIRWVDDNAGAGPGPKACDNAKFTSIQAAIDASSAYDKVYVCPGTYVEQLTIDVKGLLVKSMPRHAAHIVAPDTLTPGDDGVISVVRLTKYAARFNGFRVEIPAGEPALVPVGSAVASCTPVDAAIYALGNRNRVNHNFIDATGDYTFSGECGYTYGIVVGDHLPFFGAAGFGSPYPRETIKVKRNVVRDFKIGGILVEGADTKAYVARNSVRYVHRHDPYACQIFVPTGAAGEVNASDICVLNSPELSINDAFILNFGIGLEDSALVDVHKNTVFSSGDIFAQEGVFLYSGIQAIEIDGDSRIRGNHVRNNYANIVLGDLLLIVGAGTESGIEAATATAGIEVKNNTLTDGFAGLLVDANDNHVHGNRARLNVLGADFGPDSSGNVIHDNDFRFNGLLEILEESDCIDVSTGSGTLGTANTWYDNWGNYNSPEELCTRTLLL